MTNRKRDRHWTDLIGLDGQIVENKTTTCTCPCHSGIAINHITPCCANSGKRQRGRKRQKRSNLPWDFLT